MTTTSSLTDADLPTPPLAALIGRSPVTVRFRESLREAAAEPGLIVLRGEAGVGKSLAARILIAQTAPRGQNVFSVRCAGVDPAEVETRLRDARRLCVRYAPSAILLDEIGEASEGLQALLCRFVAEVSECRDVRIIATSARDLEGMTRKGLLRPEFGGTEGRTIWIPPLRVRRADVPDLVRHFMAPFVLQPPDRDGMRLLEEQEWPGNVRQLRAVVRRLGLLYDRITPIQVRRELLNVVEARPN